MEKVLQSGSRKRGWVWILPCALRAFGSQAAAACRSRCACATIYCVLLNDVLTRLHREGYQTAVYLLRRAAKEPLRSVAGRFHISPSRVSKIQKVVEAAPLTPQQERVFGKCKVKN